MIRGVIYYGFSLGLIFLVVSLQAFPSFWSRTTELFHEKYGNTTALKNAIFGNSASWSSMLTVDPSTIVSRMIQHAGIFVTPAMDRDMKLVGEFCHADSCQLNLVDRRLLIHNFTVRLPGDQDDALRVQRIAIQWDSYLKPCLEIEVDDVYILVDFFNVLLTKNNWMEMSKQGFPPTFEEEEEESPTEDYNPQDSMVRVGSLTFSGNVNLLVNSKPMQKQISNVTFAFEKLKEFERIIQEESIKNLEDTGRRGCTTTAVYELVDRQIKAAIQKGVTNILADIALDGGQGTKGKLQAIKEGAKQTFKDYLLNAGEWSEQQLQNRITDELGKNDDNPETQSKRKQALINLKRFGLAQLSDIINAGEQEVKKVEEDEL